MLIYNRKAEATEIYNLEAKTDKIIKYKRNVLKRYSDDLFFTLRTNYLNTTRKLGDVSELPIYDLQYDNSTCLDVGTWSNLEPEKIPSNKLAETLEKYINGDYSTAVPTRVFGYISGKEQELYRLLKTRDEVIVSSNSHGNVWQMDGLINLPRNLYLLALLENGYYKKIVNENITRMLELFDINYIKTVTDSAIREMLQTGLLYGSMDMVAENGEIGSKILSKVKNR